MWLHELIFIHVKMTKIELFMWKFSALQCSVSFQFGFGKQQSYIQDTKRIN